MPKFRTRFAPSPTGYLHLGHAHSALVASKLADENNFILRIEDIDTARCRPEFETAIIEDLSWLGLFWQTPIRRQSEHMDDYQTELSRLKDMGLTYPCFCTRKEIQEEIAAAGNAPHAVPTGPDGFLYPGTCRHKDPMESKDKLDAGILHAVRLKTDKAMERVGPLSWVDLEAGKQTARPEFFGDVILARKDTPSSYHLATTIDDALQKITLVTRGRDLFDATHVHCLLQALLDLPSPDYNHHRLIMGPDNKRLAKRTGASTLRQLREEGKTPDDVRTLAGFGGNQ